MIRQTASVVALTPVAASGVSYRSGAKGNFKQTKETVSRTGNDGISVVIPTLNEERYLNETLERVTNEPGIEVIVVDGGSVDETPVIAENWGARVIHSAPGRARQMNNGASEAKGAIVLFLHADTFLPKDWPTSVREVVSRSNTSLGSFLHTFDDASLWHRFISLTVNLRSWIFRLPYGDQALFLPRKTWDQLKGYQELPILEELDLIRRAKKLGRIRFSSKKVTTSARRGRRQGELRTTIANDILLIGFALHIHPRRLLPVYRWVTRSHKKPQMQPGASKLRCRNGPVDLVSEDSTK